MHDPQEQSAHLLLEEREVGSSAHYVVVVCMALALTIDNYTEDKVDGIDKKTRDKSIKGNKMSRVSKRIK